MTEAGGEVVVDKPRGLHEGVADSGADETKATLEEFFAELDGEIRFGGDLLQVRPPILKRRAANEVPDEFVEGIEFLLDPEEGFGVGDGGLNFESIANDAGIAKERSSFCGVVASDSGWIEAAEKLAVTFAFLEDSVPAKAGLRAFKDQELEPAAIVVDGNAPFFVVVLDVERVFGPGAADDVSLFCHRFEPCVQTVPAMPILDRLLAASVSNQEAARVRQATTAQLTAMLHEWICCVEFQKKKRLPVWRRLKVQDGRSIRRGGRWLW